MENILLKIVNTIVINKQNVDRVGLLKGMAGITLFLYEYSYLTKCELYNDLADDMLDDIFESSKNLLLTDMANGLSGIGWCIGYLIQKKFVDGDPDEVLGDVHKKMLENIKNNPTDTSFDIPLSNYGLYIISRIKDKNIEDNYLLIIRDILNINSKALECEDALSFMYLNSIIYFFVIMEQRNICNDEIAIGLNKLPNAISKSIEAGLYDYSDYETFLHMIGLIDKSNIDKWIDIVEFKKSWIPIGKSVSIDFFIKNTWQSLFYPEIKYSMKGEYDFDKIVEDIQQCLHNDNLTLYSGLAGIGLGIIFNEANTTS